MDLEINGLSKMLFLLSLILSVVMVVLKGSAGSAAVSIQTLMRSLLPSPSSHPELAPSARPPHSSSLWPLRISSAVLRTWLPLVACANGSGCILKGASDGVAAGKAFSRAPLAPTEPTPPHPPISSCPSLRLSPPPPCSCPPPPPCGCSLPLPPALPRPGVPQSVSCWQWMQRSWSLALRWWTLHSLLPLAARLPPQC